MTPQDDMNQLTQFVLAHPYLTGATVLALVMVAVVEFRVRAQSFAAVSPIEATRLANAGALLLDVRTAEAYAEGHLAGARNLPSAAIADGAKQIEKWKQKNVVVYCDTGLTAGAAARHLQRLGFTQVQSLRGGIAAWKAENLPLVKGRE